MAEGNGKTSKETKKALKSLENTFQRFSEDMLQVVRGMGNNLEVHSEAFVSQQISGIMSGARPVPVSYEEGDQSPLSGDEAQFLRNMWAGGMDYIPHEPMFVYLSDWLKTIYSGDYEGFLKMIENKRDEELKKMLSKRESLVNVSAIFHVIIGARTFRKGNKTPTVVLNQAKDTLNVKNDHMKILIKLLLLGVDVNVHDVAGFTPLHHCVSSMGNETTFKMAERLLRAGAKVNAKNRFGETPLTNVAMTTHYDAVQLLLDHGADPYIKDNDGTFPLNTHRWNQKLQKMFGESYKKKIKEQVRHPDYESQSKCTVCGKKSNTKKCNGCYFVWYCGSTCQREDWKNHKDLCQKTKSQYKIGKYDSKSCIATFAGMSGSNYSDPPHKNKNLKKKHFVSPSAN